MVTRAPGPTTQELLDNLDVIAFYLAHVPGFKVNGHVNVKVDCPFGCGGGLSFSVEREKGVYLCHRCGAKGSPWGFLEQKGLDTVQIRSALMDFQRGGTFQGSAENGTKPKKPPLGPVVATYDYVDEAGELLFQVTRHDPKDFRQRHKGPDGNWINNIIGVRRVLYGLPGLIDAVKAGWTIYICEGEKDAEAINDRDSGAEVYATTAPMGAMAKWLPEYTPFLAGARVVLVADKGDKGDVGIKRALDVRFHLLPVAKSVRVVLAKTGKDGFDHLAAGHSLADFVEMPEPGDAATEPPEPWARSTFENINDPNAGSVEYLIDGLIPKGEVTVVGATWKTAKTLVVYHLALAGLSGRRVFGRFAIPKAIKVCVFQLEMPEREDLRRYRRLALGLGMLPEEVTAFARDGQLVHYNRPDLNLCTPEGVKAFQNAVIASGAQLVIVDSLIAAFAGADINDNSVVRKLFAAAFKKLTSLGFTIILLHHKRKVPAGFKYGQDDDRSSLLAAQAWGAAAGRVFTLDRLPKNGEGEFSTSFCVRLAVSGSWTPQETGEMVLKIEDKGEATTITALDDGAQAASKSLTKTQRAALALARLVRERVTIEKEKAVILVSGQTDIATRTVESGLAYAKTQGWIESRPTPGAKHNEQTLVPGDSEATL